MSGMDLSLQGLNDWGPLVLMLIGGGGWLWVNIRAKLAQKKDPLPPELLKDLELQMLRFIAGEIEGRLVTTTSIYCHEPFVNKAPHALHQSFLYLKNSGYIVAIQEEPFNPLAPPSTQGFKVQQVTEKGRKAL